MLNLDDLFKKGRFSHPKLRYWESLAAKERTVPVVEVRRPRDGLGFGPTSIVVTVADKAGVPIDCDGEPWEPQLALATVERGWPAPDPENEAVRLGLLFKTFFAQPEMRYGDGYFSSVLVTLLLDSQLAKAPPVAEVLKFVRVAPPGDSPSKEDCAENIRAVLSRAASLLVDSLNYTTDQAKVILADAVAYYLDDRFSISSGRILGLYQ
ncbi:MAG: hypothetical protein R3B70_44885 [Polyangiaceae bacterium]